MTEGIIIAVITGACAVIGQWLISRQAASKRQIEEAKRDQNIEDRIKSLEDKIDIHNGYAEKFTALGTDIAVIKAEIENLSKRE